MRILVRSITITALTITIAIVIGSIYFLRQYSPGPMSVDELKKEPIEFALDIPYAFTDNPRQKLDLYLPKKPASPKLPVIVYIHGGAWAEGDKSEGARRLIPFVRDRKYAGVSIGYRLVDQAIWPAQLNDCRAAIRWIKRNSEEYGLDSSRIVVWGISAGAHLALMLGVTADIAEMDKEIGSSSYVSSGVSGVINFYGVADLLALIGQPSEIDRSSPNSPEAILIGGNLQENQELANQASPMTFITPNDPPVLTIHGTADRIVPYDQSVRLDRALNAIGVQSYFISIPNGGHGENIPESVNNDVKNFISKVLLNDVKISMESLN